ncbi:MAG: L-glyceraldehyde 3-phosphate reductase [Prevotellaceae bacterium]|jgi:L-glyceraldehyde 3-phosphate reductase|nr:L-glyceraldehyde 3-phosphate reductase [Prevotellaceae bacterium]
MYQPSTSRYNTMQYRRCGRSGIKLPMVSLGLWHNFGSVDVFENCRSIIHTAFDAGITHFDLANNYGPVPGSAEETFGKILKTDLYGYRDELIISTKAGYEMWDGPYGDFGSKKYLVASLDQSLKRMGLDYVDIFYHHRPDPETPLEETMAALDLAVRQGKALYAGISNYYNAEDAQRAFEILQQLGTPCLIHQPRYSMFDRRVEQTGVLDVQKQFGVGCIPFSPLAQGLLTDKYLDGIPESSRATLERFLKKTDITEEKIAKVKQLNEIAKSRGQKMVQLALAWLLKDERISSVLIGASKPEQVSEAVGALNNLKFSAEELAQIAAII